jgi:hypothetical protein
MSHHVICIQRKTRHELYIWWHPVPSITGQQTRGLRTGSLNAFPRDLSPVETDECVCILVLAPLNLLLRCGEDDLDVARVALVRIDATVCTVRAAAGFLEAHEHRILMRERGLVHTGACCTTMLLIVRSSSSRLLASALDSAFLSKRVMNLTDFSGQRPV